MNEPKPSMTTESTYQLTAEEKERALERAERLRERLRQRHAEHQVDLADKR